MKLSKRGEYALRALIDLGIAHVLGRPLVKLCELAEKERLPVKYVEQILTQLRDAGYVDTKRGKTGGYFLAMPAHAISLGAVIRLIDAPLAPISCVSTTPPPKNCVWPKLGTFDLICSTRQLQSSTDE